MATAPASSLSLTIRRHYAAPREKVFRSWTDPKELSQWWGPPGHDSPDGEVDLRVGGRYRLAIRKVPGGPTMYVNGVYQEIVAPERLVFTWNWEPGGPPYGSNTLVTIQFLEANGGTDLVLTHERFDSEAARDSHTEGWTGALDKLTSWVGA